MIKNIVKFNKLLSILLCISMIMSIFPINVFASEIESNEDEIISEMNDFKDDNLDTFLYDENGNLIESEDDLNIDKNQEIEEDVSDDENILDDELESQDNSSCTCNSVYDVHDDTCPLYVVVDDVGSSGKSDCVCNTNTDIHSKDCPLYEEIIDKSCSCVGDTHEEDCQFYEGTENNCECLLAGNEHVETCPLYIPVETECTCNTESDIHMEGCPLYKEIVSSLCGCPDGIHIETCHLYEPPVEDEKTCTCGSEDNIHTIDCDLYEELDVGTDSNAKTCNCIDGVHNEECPFYESTEVDIAYLLSIDNLSEFYDSLVSNEEYIRSLSSEEIDLLILRADELFNVIAEPTEDDVELNNSIINFLNQFIIIICLECGETDGNHSENCSNYIEKCEECNKLDGKHLETCSQYVVVCEECGGKDNLHIEECSLFICSECGEHEHLEDCSLYKVEIDVYFELLDVLSLFDMWDILNNEELEEQINDLSESEIEVLIEHVFDISDDEDLEVEILMFLYELPNAPEAPWATLDNSVITFDLSFGNVSLTDDLYSGYDLDGNLVEGEHNIVNQYIITQTDSSTPTTNVISVGASGAPVSSDFIVLLSGVNIQTTADCALSVTNIDPSIVAIILADNTENILYSMKNRAGLEKSGGASSTGTLVITCEDGYDAWLNDSDSGHTDSNGYSGCDSSCGHLDARSGNAWDGTDEYNTYYGGAGIGTAGYGSGGSNKVNTIAGTNALVNLTIAGGNITAVGAYGNGKSNSSGGGASIGTGSSAASSKTAGNIVGLKITGGTINALRGDNSAACIGGGYRSGYTNLSIFGGTINAFKKSGSITTSNKVRAPGIGGGGGGTGSASPAGATVNIYGGYITASSQYGAAIGAGAGGSSGNAQKATINIYDGYINAYTTAGDGNGAGAAIGTGGSIGSGYGGEATVNIHGGYIVASSELGADIGGGGTNSTSTTGVGGSATIDISGGEIIAMTGGIGGGRANAGIGGTANLTISGGIINASSINGGNSKLNDGGRAIVTIIDGIINTGSIGGGICTEGEGKIGSAEVDIRGGEIYGQIIMDSTNLADGQECYFKMSGGTIDMTPPNNGYDFDFAQENGAVVYIIGGSDSEDAIAQISGGIIRNATAVNGGAVYIAGGGSMLISDGVIEDCIAIQDGGAIYLDGGDFTMTGGKIRDCEATNGGAIYIKGGNVDIYDGVIDSNSADVNGGAIYVTSDTTDILINVFSGQIINNKSGNHAGAIGASVDGDLKVTINIGEEECLGINPHIHDAGDCPIIKNNVADIYGGAFCLHGNSDALEVNIYCGDVDGNLALRYPGSNTINQSGGKFVIYGGQIDPGVMVGGGIFEDNRIDAEQIYVRFWGNYEGAPSEPVIIECTLGITLNFPVDTYVNGTHELSGWTSVPNGKDGWVPVGGQYAIYQDDDEYLDYYAVWDAVVSYIVYIPEGCNIEDNGIGEINLSAITTYFKKDSNLQVFINSDFELENVLNNSDIIRYQATTTEPGINGVLKNNDLVASWQYNNLIDKILTLMILDNFTSGNYAGTITFNVVYSE